MRTFGEGEIIPWGLSWLSYVGELFLCINFRLPFYWVDRDYCHRRMSWGSAVFRWIIGLTWPKIVWVPDEEFDKRYKEVCGYDALW